jgi:hypothetical protein
MNDDEDGDERTINELQDNKLSSFKRPIDKSHQP